VVVWRGGLYVAGENAVVVCEDVRWMGACWLSVCLSNLAAEAKAQMEEERKRPRPAANSVPHPSL
jgi:hypothetical protein